MRERSVGRGSLIKMKELACAKFDFFGGRSEIVCGVFLPDPVGLVPTHFK